MALGGQGFRENEFRRVDNAFGPHYRGQFTEDVLARGVEIEEAVEQRDVDAGIGQRQLFGAAAAKQYAAAAGSQDGPLGTFEHRRAESTPMTRPAAPPRRAPITVSSPAPQPTSSTHAWFHGGQQRDAGNTDR
ncbi:MAG: hypothetical protein RMK57_04565 [Bryobacterales bacterium]|nr:hypothetical protein [Bryobacteraceae bacterium]MDW8353785.1 hypothetical protein [Bryobacterales bacterium]